MKTEKVALSQVRVNQNNPRTIREQKLNLLCERLLVFPKMISIRPVVVDDMMVVLGGNMRVNALNRIASMSFDEIAEIIGKTKNYQRLTDIEKEMLLSSWQSWLDKPTVEIVRASELSEAEKREFIIADNASFGEWDYDRLANEWDAEDLNTWGVDVWRPEDFTSFGGNAGGLAAHEGEGVETDINEEPDTHLSLTDKFIIPPFSVLDTSYGYWQERKAKWREIIGDIAGSRDCVLIKSPEVRYNHLYKKYEKERKALGIGFTEFLEKYVSPEEKAHHDQGVHSVGTSLFDPVLSEILCRWFTPHEGAKIFDCFAGDTQKGFVFAHCGYEFTGIELRQEQVDVNNEVIAERGLPIRYICDDGQNVAKHFEPESQDLLFSCPPYYNLEVYSDMQNDASNQDSYEGFLEILENAFSNALKCLKQNRFAVIVVSDVRDRTTGSYYGLPYDVKRIFFKHGAKLYNEMVLVECVGSSGMRAEGNMNRNGRKVTKIHQNVLVFFKGDTSVIRDEFGAIELSSNEQALYDQVLERYTVSDSTDTAAEEDPATKYDTEEDAVLRELGEFRKPYMQQKLVSYERYPAIKEAILRGDLHIERDETGAIIGELWMQNLKTKKLSRIYEIISSRKGLGRKLIEKAVAEKKHDKLQLFVVDYNQNAIDFYVHMGFVEVERETGKKINNITMEYRPNADTDENPR